MPKKKHSEIEMGRYNYYLPKPLIEKLADFARKEGRAQSAVITEVLADFLAKQGRIKPKAKAKTAREIFEESGI